MPELIDVVVIGAGFAGVGLAVRLRDAGRDSFVVLERGPDVGGTWRDNHYPGAACDVPSHLYSYSFALNPRWTKMYAPQAEILQYLKDVASNHGVMEHVRLNTEVTSASWNESRACWHVETARESFEARVLVVAVGHLSEPKPPAIPGIGTFEGVMFHSARWDDSIDLAGMRVGVIGSGATAIQVIPEVSKVASEVVAFQRTPAYIMPRPDPEYSDAQKRMFERLPETMQSEREAMFWFNEERYAQRRNVPALVDAATQVALAHLERQVPQPELRDKLTPRYTLGCKRVLKSDDFYPAMASDHVTLEVNPISAVEPAGVRLADGTFHDLDALILCTGFEATDLPISYIIHGEDELILSERWREGMQAYATSAVNGFPNMWFINGPNTGTGHNSAVYMSEVQIDYILGALDFMEQVGASAIQVTPEAEEAYATQLTRWSEGSVWLAGSCDSWYLDSRNGKLTTLWPSSAYHYRTANSTFDPAAYDAREEIHA